jgi:nicotinamide-nucleotide amidase
VPEPLIAAHGAVSAEVALAMAQGALAHSAGHAQCAVAVTGIAGPGGGSAGKPVGTVWLALAWALARQGGATEVTLLQLQGDRRSIREQTVQRALAGLIALATQG